MSLVISCICTKEKKESERQSDAKLEIKRRMEEATAQNYFQNRRKDTVQQ